MYFLVKFQFIHSRVMGLYSSNCRRFFVCRTVNWEPLDQFTSNFAQLLELIVLRSVYFLVKYRFLWCSCWGNLDFSFKSYGKESLYKYCMNVDDGRIMHSWRSCVLDIVGIKIISSILTFLRGYSIIKFKTKGSLDRNSL